jgi:hypothetical protein
MERTIWNSPICASTSKPPEPDKGYWFKLTKMACPSVEIACDTGRNWATTPDFLPEFETMERDLQFPIELGQRAGWKH